MADTYRMVTGIVFFIVFLSVGLSMASSTLPDLAPGGQNPINSIPTATQPVFKTPAACGSGDWICGVATFATSVTNGLISAFSVMAGIMGMLFALMTFQIPALQANPFLQLVNVLLVICVVVPLSLFAFRLVKGLIPTVGGDAD